MILVLIINSGQQVAVSLYPSFDFLDNVLTSKCSSDDSKQVSEFTCSDNVLTSKCSSDDSKQVSEFTCSDNVLTSKCSSDDSKQVSEFTCSDISLIRECSGEKKISEFTVSDDALTCGPSGDVDNDSESTCSEFSDGEELLESSISQAIISFLPHDYDSDEELPFFYENKEGTCATTTIDYSNILKMLTLSAQKSYENLKTTVGYFASRIRELEYKCLDRKLMVHGRSLEIMQKCGDMVNGVLMPADVSGDGNCLFNAVSVGLCGCEDLATELRVRTCIEMVENSDFYQTRSIEFGFDLISPSFADACIACAIHNSYSSMLTIQALATVIDRRIRSVYPSVNGLLDNRVPIMNHILNPRKNLTGTLRQAPLLVMWTTHSELKPGHWNPDHFAPLLPKDVFEPKAGTSSQQDAIIKKKRQIDSSDSEDQSIDVDIPKKRKKRKCISDSEDDYIPDDDLCDSDDDNLHEIDPNDNDIEEEDFGDYLSRLSAHLKHVTVPTYQSVDGKRDYRKADYCLYCKRVFTSKISSHLCSIHASEPEIIKYHLIRDPNEKKKHMRLLQNEGNFRHNCKVIKEGHGTLVVVRRPNKTDKPPNAVDYVPCEFCKGFFYKGCLSEHATRCHFKPMAKQPDINYIRTSRNMLSPFVPRIDEDTVALNLIFSRMRETVANPGIPGICEKDELIGEFALSLYSRLGTAKEQRRKDLANLRTKVRLLGMLLKALNENNGEENWISLSSYLRGPHFHQIVKCVKKLALEKDSPSVAINLGIYIKHCIVLKMSMGIFEGDKIMQEEGRDFEVVYRAHWNNTVSCVANRRIKLRKLNQGNTHPVADDLVVFKDWLDSEIDKALMIHEPTSKQWKHLAYAVLVRIVLFNRRRISEVEEMIMSDFENIVPDADQNQEILQSLSLAEQLLVKRMRVIEIRGKSTRSIRGVYILLTEKMVKAIEHILDTRQSTSDFIFARKRADTPLDGCTAMREMTKLCPGLNAPERIRSTKLRSFFATTLQILSMKPNELKMVADHMGHDVKIHADVYCLQSSLVEKAKVAKVLLAAENGIMARFKGKSLEDIDPDALPLSLDYADKWTECEDSENSDDSDDNDMVDAEVPPKMETNQSEAQNEKSRIKRAPWTKGETDIFCRILHNYLNNKRMAPAVDLRKVVEELGGSRTLPQVRTRLHNIISKKQKTK
ncbi:uncharacterized protein LOC141907100 [Tubulanus polymorphus]|uniref:uncharacterized protein LOC141907100 n=1 Tax=Tubulanus polymorphus TaxID=672921 RepID=UPI003DA57838